MSLKFDAGYLIAAGEKPFMKAIKTKSYALMQLKKGMTILDIGCGPGLDTLNMAKIVGAEGNVFGIDADNSMIEIATNEVRKRGLEQNVHHMVSDSTATDFEDDYFDACRCERVLQHLSKVEAKQTVAEAMRITKPGGNLVFVDSDWASLTIHCNNPQLERKITHLFTNSIRNGYAARGLPELFFQTGITDIKFEIQSMKLSFSDLNRLLGPLLDVWINKQLINALSVKKMLDNLISLEESGVFFSTLNIITCYGRNLA